MQKNKKSRIARKQIVGTETKNKKNKEKKKGQKKKNLLFPAGGGGEVDGDELGVGGHEERRS